MWQWAMIVVVIILVILMMVLLVELMGKKGLAAVHGVVYFSGEGVGVACLQTLEF